MRGGRRPDSPSHCWCGKQAKRDSKYCTDHSWNRRPPDAIEKRFWSKVNKDGPVPECRPDLGPCWLWTGTIANSHGYGRFHVNRVGVPAHRYICELMTGPIPDGYEPDHLCFNPSCVNISHLEVVTQRENTLRSSGRAAINARKTHCDHGHLLDEANVRMHKGRRICRKCERARTAARNVVLKEERRVAKLAASTYS